MKIITTNVNKGGAGKTTFTFNFAEYLSQTSRVLLLDFDDSANLTNRYANNLEYGHTVMSLFEKGEVTPVNIKNNLDMIAGHREVELLKEKINTRRRREYIFAQWIAKNLDTLEAKYDYIVIDTENDEGILTLNALIVSDAVIGIAEASKDNVLALAQLREFVNELNREFERDIDLYFIANKINLSETASNDLLKTLNSFNEYLGYLPRRTVLASDESIFEQSTTKNKEVVIEVSKLFKAIKKEMDEEV